MVVLLAFILLHGWYDSNCCGDKDCQPVPCDQISMDRAGDYIWLRGPHDRVVFTKQKMKPSLDESCHVCVANNVVPAGICIYLPPRV